MPSRATAFAPATIGNVGVGFDVLGLAIEGAGDRVTATRVDLPGVSLQSVFDGAGNPHPTLTVDAASNTASIAADALWQAHGSSGGIALEVHKGVPLQSGMGSSAASAVAAAVAVNALLDSPLATAELLPFALKGEGFVSGGMHADNVAPGLLGGLVLCPPPLAPRMISIPVPDGVSSVLVHPELSVNTAESRQGLSQTVTTEQWISQQGYLAAFVSACASGDIDLLADSLEDIIVEPQRETTVSCFRHVKDAAMAAGALGCSLSGSGPSIFALCRDEDADELAERMSVACRDSGIECQSWVSPMSAPGALVEDTA